MTVKKDWRDQIKDDGQSVWLPDGHPGCCDAEPFGLHTVDLRDGFDSPPRLVRPNSSVGSKSERLRNWVVESFGGNEY